ncbi:hypothetical protein [Amycolatopsis taiwanensis]|uniref:hypothetical protein n=1 Tax=Amycolatopsis taiwanensis TaxID=342230 RepID=UPI000480804B|nr:hypothetical protein [Amycolatopsis taiwanensis]
MFASASQLLTGTAGAVLGRLDVVRTIIRLVVDLGRVVRQLPGDRRTQAFQRRAKNRRESSYEASSVTLSGFLRLAVRIRVTLLWFHSGP